MRQHTTTFSIRRTLAWLLLANFFFLAIEATANLPGRTKAFFVRGSVTLVNNQNNKRMELERGYTFMGSHTVLTGARSTVFLQFSNGSSIILGPNSMVTIDKFTQENYNRALGTYNKLKADPSRSTIEIKLVYGNVIGDAKKLRPNSRIQITTPRGSADVRSRQYVVAYDMRENSTTVTNVKGTLTANYNGSPIKVDTGKEIVMSATGATAPAPANPRTLHEADRSFRSAYEAGLAAEIAEKAGS